MTISLASNDYAEKILQIEAKLKINDLKLSTSRKVVKIFKSLQREGYFNHLSAERRLLPRRIFIHPRRDNACENLKRIVDFLKKGLIFRSLKNVSQDEKKSAFANIWPVCHEVHDKRGLVNLPHQLASMSSSQRTVICQVLALLTNPDDTYLNKNKILEEFCSIDMSQCMDIAQTTRQLSYIYHPLPDSIAQMCKIIRALKFLDPAIRPGIFDIHPTILKESFSEFSIIQTILLEDPRSMKLTHDYLRDMLHKISDPQKAKSLAETMITNKSFFLIEDENSLIELAITVLGYVDNMDCVVNPYVVYNRLSSRSLLASHVKPKIEHIQGISCYIDLSAIKNSFGKLLTKDELIEQMGSFFMPEHYLALVSKMDERILSLSSEEKSSVLQYVPSSLSSRYSVLYRNLIDPFFSALLNISEDEKLRVPQMAFQAILKFISNQSCDLAAPSLLSPQEEMLLKFSESVQDCRAGKEEGILSFYNSLPLSVRIHSDSDDLVMPQRKIARAAIMNTIQDYINELISTPSAFMLNASMFSKDIPQLAHHSLYIKNVLYKAFSIPHSLTFDFHTMVLSQGMVKKSSKEIAHLFMEHFSVLGLMSRLQKTFELSSSSEGLYTAFSSVIHSDISKEVVWQVSEEDFSVLLTPMGALFVLIGLGFVKLA